MAEVPEKVYRDAWVAKVGVVKAEPGDMTDEEIRRYAGRWIDAGFRAAVDSAYRAGYGQGRDDEAGDCPLGSDALGPLDHVVAHHEDRTHAEIADVKRGEDQ